MKKKSKRPQRPTASNQISRQDVMRWRFNTINKMSLVGFDRANISPSARHVWLVLWRSARHDGRVKISYGRIAEETGRSRRHCIRSVNELIDKNAVRILKKGGKPDRPNLFKIRIYPPDQDT